MIEKTLKTTMGWLRIMIPTQLTEVTLGQMMQLQDNPEVNDIRAISILSGISFNQLQNVINITDFALFSDVALGLAHQLKYLYDSDDIPKQVTLAVNQKNKLVKITNNLSIEPAGAYMAASDIIADEVGQCIAQYGESSWQQHYNPSLNACCQVLAHYLYTRATGNKYNEYEAEAFCETIKTMRVTEALPIAKNFFTCYPNLSKPSKSYYQRLRRYWKRRQGLILSKSSNISTP